ncbi:MAG: MBL fold metallo-hydrolase, partial [Acidobacteriaceae bacterium]|nr:MBL fold metallo-hydrolase [Acidobacteriaceae bacterium]
MSSLNVTMLGTGTSHGVPMIGCDCAVCTSSDPRDRRSRSSILLEFDPASDDRASSSFASATRSVLVDTSPDLRAQALTNDVRRVDAIVYTHSHADHIFGLDEVRRFNHLTKQPMHCFADARTAADIRRTFAYIFDPSTEKGGGVPSVTLTEIAGPFCLGRVEFVPIPLQHGSRQILGFRVGRFAYLTDCNAIPDASFALLDGVEILVLDALCHRPHPT